MASDPRFNPYNSEHLRRLSEPSSLHRTLSAVDREAQQRQSERTRDHPRELRPQSLQIQGLVALSFFIFVCYVQARVHSFYSTSCHN